MLEMVGSCPSAKQAASRTYPLQFLLDMTAMVLDDETGELLEYRYDFAPKTQEGLGPLIWLQDRAPCARYAKQEYRDKHYLLYPQA